MWNTRCHGCGWFLGFWLGLKDHDSASVLYSYRIAGTVTMQVWNGPGPGNSSLNFGLTLGSDGDQAKVG